MTSVTTAEYYKTTMATLGDLGVVARVAGALGTSENILRLVISLFTGMPCVLM